MITNETRIIDLTVAELQNIIGKTIKSNFPPVIVLLAGNTLFYWPFGVLSFFGGALGEHFPLFSIYKSKDLIGTIIKYYSNTLLKEVVFTFERANI